MRGRVVPFALACLLALGAAAGARAANSPTPIKDDYFKRFLGKRAPAFTLKDTAGRDVRLSDYRGKIVLLNFWYSACFPCRMETPDLINLYEKHRDGGVVVLGINTDPLIMPQDGGQMMHRFIDSYRIPYPVLVADRKVYDDYGRTPIAPITLLVDKQGMIGRIFWGATPGAAFEQGLRTYLDARADNAGSSAAGAGPYTAASHSR